MRGLEYSLLLDRESELLNELTVCCNANNIKVWINHLPSSGFKSPVALDVEHDESGNFVGCGLAMVGDSNIYYFSDVHLLHNADILSLDLICHNGRSDFEVLRNWGIDVKDSQLVHDTELIAHIIDSSRKGYGLKKLAEQDLGITYPSYDDIVGRRTLKQIKERRTLDKWPVEIVSLYNALDCYVTYKLYEFQHRQSSQITKDYYTKIERPVSFILSQMEARGVRVDINYLNRLKTDLEIQQIPIEREIKNELGNINLNSPKQLLEALNAKEIYPNFKGRPSTDKRALGALQESPIVSALLRYSELDTLLSSFVLPYLERGTPIVHPWFNQGGTRTGRLSCSNPNLLQIPRRTDNGKLVRRMFIPRDGMVLGDCDFGQIEPRVLAHLSKDPNLCSLFIEGTDFHDFTADRLGIDRERAKVLNLSVGYRATFKSVMSQLRCSKNEAQEQIDRWWDLFPTLRRWQDCLIYEARRSGFCTTLMGLRIKIDSLSDGNSWKREHAERQLINNITQGSAAEIMKMAMINIANDPWLKEGFGLLVQVYDELLFETQENDDVDIVKYHMENAIKLDVPLTADAHSGMNWDECKQ